MEQNEMRWSNSLDDFSRRISFLTPIIKTLEKRRNWRKEMEGEVARKRSHQYAKCKTRAKGARVVPCASPSLVYIQQAAMLDSST